MNILLCLKELVIRLSTWELIQNFWLMSCHIIISLYSYRTFRIEKIISISGIARSSFCINARLISRLRIWLSLRSYLTLNFSSWDFWYYFHREIVYRLFLNMVFFNQSLLSWGLDKRLFLLSLWFNNLFGLSFKYAFWFMHLFLLTALLSFKASKLHSFWKECSIISNITKIEYLSLESFILSWTFWNTCVFWQFRASRRVFRPDFLWLHLISLYFRFRLSFIWFLIDWWFTLSCKISWSV